MANSKNKKQSSASYVGKSKTISANKANDGKEQSQRMQNSAKTHPRQTTSRSNKDELGILNGKVGENRQQSAKQANGTASQQAKQQSQDNNAKKQTREVKFDDSQSAKIKPTNPQESEQNNAEKLDDSKNPQDKQPPKHHWWLDAIYFIGGTLALGGIASLLGGKMFDFGGYNLPPATAPAWLFPIMWALIYIAIGVATFCMWRDKQISAKDRKINLILYFIHMAFNITWPLWFFMLSQPIVACVWLAIIIVLALITTWRYFVANLASGIIFCVYVLWLIYAFYLNLGVCLLL